MKNTHKHTKIDAQLVKRCTREAPQSEQRQATQAPESAPSLWGAFFGVKSPQLANSVNLGALSQSAASSPLANRLATKWLPPTQQKPAERLAIEAAQRARQSPSMSLFNRLHGLVIQLQQARDFFVDWPQQMCQQRARRSSSSGDNSYAALSHHYQLRSQRATTNGSATTTTSASGNGNNNNNNVLLSSSSTTECWNGRDFGG